jgi:HrpA-like RNA helicase
MPGGEGDVLVFMPGGFEISQTLEAIRHTSEAKGFILLPLHGEFRPVIRTRRWRVTSNAKSSSPRTSPRPR